MRLEFTVSPERIGRTVNEANQWLHEKPAPDRWASHSAAGIGTSCGVAYFLALEGAEQFPWKFEELVLVRRQIS